MADPVNNVQSGGADHIGQMRELMNQKKTEALETAKMNLEMARTDALVNFTKKVGESSKAASA